MKKWIKGVVLATFVLGAPTGLVSYMGWQYKYAPYVGHTIQSNAELPNYERNVSLSISFEKDKEMKQAPLYLQKLNSSIMTLHEVKTRQGHAVDYGLTSDGEEFRGNQLYAYESAIVKSPMYHRYITFEDTSFAEEGKSDTRYIQEAFFSLLEEESWAMNVYRNRGANEKDVKTLIIKNQHETVHRALKELAANMDKGLPYQSILLNNERIKNHLLKEGKSEGEVEQVFTKDLSSYQAKMEFILNHAKVTDSEIELKITKKRIIKEASATIKMVYISPHTHAEIPFTLYFDLNTWNVGKAKLNGIEINQTNSLPYKWMTDDRDYFKEENLDMEMNATEDKQHIQKGFTEKNKTGIIKDSATLEEMGNDFTPVIPSEK